MMCFMKRLFKPFMRELPPFIELRGRDSMHCDGGCRIAVYSDKRIVLGFDGETLEINGKGLTLRHLSAERLAIDGRIDGIGFLSADKTAVR